VQLLAVALVVALSLTAWFAVREQAAEEDLDRAEAALGPYETAVDAEAAARELLVDMTSYDYRDLEGSFDWLEVIQDEELRTTLTQNAEQLEEIVARTRAIAEGEIGETAYLAVSDEEARVVAFVRQEIRDTRNKGFRVEEQWVTLTMVRDGAGWAVAGFDFITVPPPSEE